MTTDVDGGKAGIVTKARLMLSQRDALEKAILAGRARFCVYSGTNWTATPGTVTAGATVNTSTGFFARPGKVFYLTSLSMDCDGDAYVFGTISPDAAGNWASYVGVSTLPYQTVLNFVFGADGGNQEKTWPKGLPIFENGSLAFSYKTKSTTARNVSWIASGYEVVNEVNVDAAIKMLVVGDSISADANMGNDADSKAYLGKWAWHRKLCALARAQGVDAQVFANLAEDGRTAREMFYNLETGKYNVDYDILLVAAGANDAASGSVTETNFKEAVQGFIDYRDRNYPGKNKKILFCAPPVTDTATRTTLLPSIRTWMSDVVTAAGGAASNVDYVDWSQAFALGASAATDTNFKDSERSAGNRLHPSGIGQSALGQYTFDQKKSFLFGL